MANYTSAYTGSQIDQGIGKGLTAYQKPSGGIPKTDLASAVQSAITPTYATATISSSTGWTNNTYTTLNTPYPFASYDIEVSISPNATSTQRDAYAEAMFTGHSDSNDITALGTKPTVDIPIVIRIWSKV